ncbi:MAG: hypothetical protein ACRDD1_00070 [Planctomycetia bacterium]
MSMETNVQPPLGGMRAEQIETAYRPISRLAIISGLFALASLLSFADPIFWFIPVAAFAVSVTSSRFLDKAKQEYAGQLLAKLAVLVSLAAGIGSITRYSIEYVILTTEARAYANEFVDDVLSNRPKEAFAKTVAPLNRSGMEDALDQLIVRQGPSYREFLGAAFPLTFRGKGAETQVTILGMSEYAYNSGFHDVKVSYRLVLGEQSYDATMTLKGGVAAAGEWKGRQWYIQYTELKQTPTAK